MDEQAKIIAKLNAAVVAKAIAEPAFRAQLVADPQGTVEKTLGTSLPAGLTLKVVEATPSEYTVVLPYEPKAAADGELSDADLEAVAGGSKGGAKKFFNDVVDVGNDAVDYVADNPLTVGSAVGGAVAGAEVGLGCKVASMATGQK